MKAKHGGIRAEDLAGLGATADQVLDLSANLNPYGPPPEVLEAIREACLTRYPDPDSVEARLSLSAHLDVPVQDLIVGNGASELLWCLVLTLGQRSAAGTAVLSAPAFGEVEAACAAYRVRPLMVRAEEGAQFLPALDKLLSTAKDADAAFVYLCNPGTPTGVATPYSALQSFARELAPCVLMLDESFQQLSDLAVHQNSPLPSNVVRIRSLTKDFSIPGVRVGYAVAGNALCNALSERRAAWSVSAAAQTVAALVPSQSRFLKESQARLRRDREALTGELRALGLSPFASVAPYLAFKLPGAEQVRERLLAEHLIALRECSSFGLTDVLRVAVRPDSTRLIQALRALPAGLSVEPRTQKQY